MSEFNENIFSLERSFREAEEKIFETYQKYSGGGLKFSWKIMSSLVGRKDLEMDFFRAKTNRDIKDLADIMSDVDVLVAKLREIEDREWERQTKWIENRLEEIKQEATWRDTRQKKDPSWFSFSWWEK